MILSTLMAASLALTPMQQEVSRPVQKQAEHITVVLVICRPVIDPGLWDKWLPFALNDLGITEEYIVATREVVAARDPYPVTETECLDALILASEKLEKMLESDTDGR
jgi:hypothetical protein